jgi:hypothetical protein
VSERTDETVTPPVGMTGKDEEAPYGRKPDGSPRARPGRKPGQTTGTGTRRPSTRKPAVASAETDYKTPLLGLFQIPAGALAIAGMQKPVFAADAAAITIHSENIAEALDQLAHERPEIAAVLDRVLQVGPYGVLIAAVAPLALQILTNHGAVPAGVMGTIPPGTLIANFMPNAGANAPDPTDNGSRERANVADAPASE